MRTLMQQQQRQQLRGGAPRQPAYSRRTAVAVRAAQDKPVALITGGNTGIGFETAKALCGKGFSVCIACRDPAKAAGAVQRIQAAVPGAEVDSLRLDLADLRSVRDAAAQWLDGGRKIDVLLNNAGVMAPPRMTTADGFELQLGVNHLGHFLWTQLLLPRIQENPGPVRIINVASMAHLFGKIDFDDLQCERNYDRWRAYGQSKLANILFTYELAKRLRAAGGAPRATANCLHPGVVRTELPRYLMEDPQSLGAKVMTALATPFTLSPEQGAVTSIFLASSPEVEGVTSKYYDNLAKGPIPSSPASYDTEVARRLWEVSEELTGAKSKASAAAAAAL